MENGDDTDEGGLLLSLPMAVIIEKILIIHKIEQQGMSESRKLCAARHREEWGHEVS